MSKNAQAATNERIVGLLEGVQKELAASRKRDEQLAQTLQQLLKRTT